MKRILVFSCICAFSFSLSAQITQDIFTAGPISCDDLSQIDDIVADLEYDGDPLVINDDSACDPITLISSDWDPNEERDCDELFDIEIEVENGCNDPLIFTLEVQLEDTEDPFFDTDPQDDSAVCDPNLSIDDLIQDWLDANGNGAGDDNCDLDVEWTNDFDAGNFVPECGNSLAGSVIVTFTITDDCGNTATADAEFIVSDNSTLDFSVDPTPIGPLECDVVANEQDILDWIADVESGSDGEVEVCDPDVTIVGSFDPADIVSPCTGSGEVLVTFTLTDCNGNSIDRVFPIFIEDNSDPFFSSDPMPPSIECSANIDADIQAFVDDVINGNNGQADDLCSGPTGVTVTSDFTSYGGDGCTDIDIEFTIEDECGNPFPQTFTVEVDDTTAPFFSALPVAPVIECSPNTDAEISDWVQDVIDGNEGTAEDDCAGFNVTITSDFTSYGMTDCSSLDIRFTLEDECGNTDDVDISITIEDTTPPELNINAPNAPIECDDGSFDTDLSNWVATVTGSATIIEDCSFLSNNDITITPDPTGITFADVIFSGCDGVVVFTFEVVDDCGNPSTAVDANFLISDTQSPFFVGIPPPATASIDFCTFQTQGAGTAGLDIFDQCEGPSVTPPGVLDDSGLGACDGVVEITWEIIDGCGNTDGDFVQEITVTPPPALAFIDPDDNLPPDIEFIRNGGECADMPFMFPGGVWDVDPIENPGDETFDPNLMFGVQFEGGCDGAGTTVTWDPPPTGEFDEGETLVTLTVDNGCDVLEYEFTVTIMCSNCAGDGGLAIFCGDCDGTIPDCHRCSADDLIAGFESCNPPFEGGIQDDQPSPVCMGQGVPNNMSWFSFVAGSSEIDASIETSVDDCIAAGGTNGIQAGIYDMCEGICLAGSGNCPSFGVDFSFNDLIVGQTYWIFVDGCAGSECVYTITISGQEPFLLDDIEAVTALDICTGEELTEDCGDTREITICPGRALNIDVIHQGNAPSDFGDFDDACSIYPPDLTAEFTWSSNIPGLGSFSIVTPDDPDAFPDDLVITEIGVYDLCIESVIPLECDGVFGPVCLTITVEDLEEDMFEYDVCVEDLIAGFDPTEPGDPGANGFGWLGTDDIFLDQVDNAPDGCITMEFLDPECDACEVTQTICINVIGNREKTPDTWFLYTCQFIDCGRDDGFEDCTPDITSNIEDYQFIWPSPRQTFDVPFGAVDFCLVVEEGSNDVAWDGIACDSLISVTVETIAPIGEIEGGSCSSAGTPYEFFFNTDHIPNDWQAINGDFLIEWIDCETGDPLAPPTPINGQDPLLVTPNIVTMTGGEVCVRTENTFADGAYGEMAAMFPTSCIHVFGPFEVETGMAIEPTILGDTLFCDSDLLGHIFTIDLPAGSTDTYTWSANNSGAPITPNATGTEVTIDFPVGYNTDNKITVIGNTACGVTPPVELCIALLPPPEPMIDITPEICVGGTATAVGIPGGTGTFDFTWDPAQPNAGTVDFVSNTPGQQTVTLTVTDENGCEGTTTATYMVLEPIEAPVVTCTSDDTSITFNWGQIDGATGYIVNATGPNGAEPAQTITDPAITTTSFTGLPINTTFTVTVIATGDAPCGDSDASLASMCTTSDCPDADFTVVTEQSISFCLGDSGPITYEVTPNDGGTMTFSGQGVTGNVFDPTGLDPGVYNILGTYIYGNQGACSATLPYQVEIFPIPVPDFSLSLQSICIDEFANIDDSNVTATATPTWDYDGSSPDANGDISWDTPGLKTITLEVLSADGCVDNSSQQIMVIDTLQPLVVTCGASDIDFVTFEWNDITGASTYDITYTVSTGATGADTGLTDTNFTVTGLDAQDEVTIIVTANNDGDFCRPVTGTQTCEAQNCIPIILGLLTCTDQGLDFVTVSWDPVNGADEYIVVVDGGAPMTITDTMITIDGLNPMQIVDISVTAVNAIAGCPNSNTQTTPCEAIPCEPLVLTGLECGDTGTAVDLVVFDWDEVPGASGYTISYTVDGGAPIDGGTIDDPTNTTFMINGLNPGENVEITVTVINAIGSCPGTSGSITCPAGLCPSPDFSTIDEQCWEAGDPLIPIVLTVTDSDNGGAPLSGSFDWSNEPLVNDQGLFEPDQSTSQTYMLEFTWTDDVSGCSFTEEVDVEVNIRPNPSIDNIQTTCRGEVVMISTSFPDNGESFTWDFTTDATLLSGSGVGPYEVSFDEPGVYEITLTVSSAQGCERTTTASVTIEDQISAPIISCGAFNNTSVTFEWNDVPGATGYQISVDGGAFSDTNDTQLALDNLVEGVPVEITVIAISGNTCPDNQMSGTCVPSSCPQAFFDPAGTYEFGGFCLSEAQAFNLPGADLIMNGPQEAVADEVWTGEGVNPATGEFDPTAINLVDPSQTIDIGYRVTYAGDGCFYDTTFQVTLYQDPQIVGVSLIDPACELTDLAQIQVEADGGTGPYTYTFGNAPAVVQPNPIFDAPTPGLYQVIVEDANGCQSVSEITVGPLAQGEVQLEGEFTLFNEDTGEFTFNVNGADLPPITDVIWFIDDVIVCQGLECDVVSLLAEQFGNGANLGIQVWFGPDCFISDEERVDIFDEDVWYIPNVISSGEGPINDKWIMFTKGDVTVQSVSIFDRWGELIHINENVETIADPNNIPGGTGVAWDLTWDGRWGSDQTGNAGDEVIQGVYVYLIELLVDENQPTQRLELEAGDITIFR